MPREPLDTPEDLPKEALRQMALGQPEDEVSSGMQNSPVGGSEFSPPPPFKEGMSLEIEVETGSIGSEVTPHQEVPMVRQERWEEIRRLWVRERVPAAEIARRLDLDWRKRSGGRNWRLWPVRGSTRCRSISVFRPSRSSNSRGNSSPASEVTVAPWNSTRSWGLNERRTGPDVASPAALT